jgi:hypothetical protein
MAKGHLCLLKIACVLVLEVMFLGSCLAAECESAGAYCNEWLVTPTDFLLRDRCLPSPHLPSYIRNMSLQVIEAKLEAESRAFQKLQKGEDA